MVTEFAKEMIKNADSYGAQDIYVIPRQDNYELYMRVGQERRLIDVYRPDFMASLIGHFKFVAGMMVGEKRRSQLGSCDYDCGDGQRVFSAFVYRWGLSWLRKFSYSCSTFRTSRISVLESRNPAYYGCFGLSWIISLCRSRWFWKDYAYA